MTRLLPLLFALALAGCATPVTGPRNFTDGSMSFAVPTRWKITMQMKQGGCGTVTVEDPENAIVLIKGFPRAKDPGLQKFATNFSRTANQMTPFADITSQGFTKFNDPVYGPSLKEKVIVSLAGVQVPHTRLYRQRMGDACVFYLFTQVSDEDAHLAEPGFREILRTFSPH